MTAQTPEPTLDGVKDALRRAHQDGVWDPYQTVASILATAGAVSEWDSETIEHVMDHTVPATADFTGLPWVGDTGQDGAAHLFWARVAQSAGWEHDWPFECGECPALLPDDDALTTHYATAHPDEEER